MKEEITDPLRGPFGALLKFVGSALFGCLISLALLLAVLWFDSDTFWSGWWPHLFWIIPIIWGLLGIVWFDHMLELAKGIFNAVFNIRD